MSAKPSNEPSRRHPTGLHPGETPCVALGLDFGTAVSRITHETLKPLVMPLSALRASNLTTTSSVTAATHGTTSNPITATEPLRVAQIVTTATNPALTTSNPFRHERRSQLL